MQFGSAIAADTFGLERRLNAPIDRVWSYFVNAEKCGHLLEARFNYEGRL